MHSDLQNTIENCKLTIQSIQTTEDLIVAAGLAELIQRHQTNEQELLKTVATACEKNKDDIIEAYRSRLMFLSEEIENTTENTENTENETQSLLWHRLYLNIGALFFLKEQARYAKTIRQICAGIGPNWQAHSGFAKSLLEDYPPRKGDLTAQFLEATIDAANVSFEDNVVPFPALWLHRKLDKLHQKHEIPTIGREVFAASSGDDDRMEQLYFGEDWELSLLFEGEAPSEILLSGTEAEVFCNDKIMTAGREADSWTWKASDGLWKFKIKGEEYSFELKGC